MDDEMQGLDPLTVKFFIGGVTNTLFTHTHTEKNDVSRSDHSSLFILRKKNF
jgi:hypothetical protein